MTTTGIPTGGFRLHWEHAETAYSQMFPCLNDALNHAAVLYANDEVDHFLQLETWLGDDACPPEQIMPIARMRTRNALEAHDRSKAHQQLEATPGYGTFS